VGAEAEESTREGSKGDGSDGSGKVSGGPRTRRSHWDDVYARVEPTSVSWYQSSPVTSLELVAELGVPTSARVIDVGGGASHLVDELVSRGYDDVSVLDVSSSAIEMARSRVGTTSPVRWITEDVVSWTPTRDYDLWHDRAVFHFLVDPKDRDRYLRKLHAALNPGGSVVVATFSHDGPPTCSGLPVAHYDADELSALLGERFETIAVRKEGHRTPAGVEQPFVWLAARARS
jgi:2-polyprenyl-3-methyl-5-hydroxy-6-metoxy-1,4-benzoquinol methylase